jgi:hypothetical protein
LIVCFLGAATLVGQSAKPASGGGPKAAKATKAVPPVTFEAHNEGGVEGPIYGDENLVTVTIDAAGIRYQGKGMDKPYAIPWDQVTGWQPNSFTSKSASRTASGDYGIGIYQGAKYSSFRTRNGHDYAAAVKALRVLAYAKERPGIG